MLYFTMTKLETDFIDLRSDSSNGGHHLLCEQRSYITSMQSSHSQLYVGTNTGLLLAMPLPKLPDSVPKITGESKRFAE